MHICVVPACVCVCVTYISQEVANHNITRMKPWSNLIQILSIFNRGTLRKYKFTDRGFRTEIKEAIWSSSVGLKVNNVVEVHDLIYAGKC